jgi:hypothetical protein
MSKNAPHDDSQYPPRAYPRAPLHSPIEVRTRSRLSIAQIENISLGGLLVCGEPTPAVSSELELMFNLAPGCTVSAKAVVRHASKKLFGVQFHQLSPAAQDAIAEYCQKNLGNGRRSGRIPKRLLVTIRGTRQGDLDELAETLSLSRNGGSLACRASFCVGDRLELFWPEKKRRAEIEVVSYRVIGRNGLLELGFQFVDENSDFWQVEFPKPS